MFSPYCVNRLRQLRVELRIENQNVVHAVALCARLLRCLTKKSANFFACPSFFVPIFFF
jgi:hypothetical protein